MRPLIGVLPLFNSENENLWINPLYMQGLEAAGGLPVLLPLSADASLWPELLRFDGYLFTGGQDVDPALYGEEKLPQCEYQAPLRDAQELYLLRELFRLDKPILGVCRGAQMINVAAGGDMYQDLPTQLNGALLHRPAQAGSRDFPRHQVSLTPGSMLHERFGPQLVVNSIHHQGVRRLGDGVICAAKAPDGLTEAVEMPGQKFVLGVQWHPEFLWKTEDFALGIFQMLVKSAESV